MSLDAVGRNLSQPARQVTSKTAKTEVAGAETARTGGARKDVSQLAQQMFALFGGDSVAKLERGEVPVNEAPRWEVGEHAALTAAMSGNVRAFKDTPSRQSNLFANVMAGLADIGRPQQGDSTATV